MACTRGRSPSIPAGGKGGRNQTAEPGVIGRVDAEHMPGERRAGQALGDHAAVRRHGRMHVLGQPRVFQRGAGLLVAASSHAPCPSARVTECTAPSSRTLTNSGNGSSWSYAPHAASASSTVATITPHPG